MRKKISIVIPVYNEKENIRPVYAGVEEVIRSVPGYEFEVIFVNDGSSDGTWKEIINLAGSGKGIKALNFSRNFGHQAAIEAGMANAGGAAVITMDGDMQHPPEMIPELIRKWEQGFEIVNTKREETEGISFFKKIASGIFYRLLNCISEVHIESGSADFRLIGRRAMDELNKLTEKNKFYRGLISWIGFESAIVKYKAGKRRGGKSSYTFNKMLSLARVGITSFSMLPMKVIFLFGALLFFGGFLLTAGMVFWRYCIGSALFSGTGILAAFIIMNNGLFMVMLGIVSMYQINMCKELQNRPNYIITEKINLN
ncbi:MAG: glycosyltransferase family 2 protein [Parcubacteria group bacterium]